MPRRSTASGRMASLRSAPISANGCGGQARTTPATCPGISSCPSDWSTGPSGAQADPQSVPGAVDLDCGIQLRGSIDLVERHPSGLVRVTDHKTGKARRQARPADRWRQVAAAAALCACRRKALRRPSHSYVRPALFLHVEPAALPSRSFRSTSEARDAAIQVAEAVGEAVAQPFLPAAPDKGQCELCDYRVVCGPHEERRTARKPQGTPRSRFWRCGHRHDRSRRR